ncbi:hypothetical protein Pst134EB_033276 [Puccinia striiformis f. sp. tritici]|nr:hypothetical protein Pst134EB_033276 [Puccinia striiformis f. sp. tritici]
MKPEPRETPIATEPGRIDLQRFKTTDGPLFTGPFQAVEPFVTWINGIQIFFATKAVWHPEDKIRILGCLIREPNTLTFYANGVDNLVTKSWAEFKTTLFDFALPPLWRTELRTQIRHMKMLESEKFITYSTRARTLQSMVNFDETGTAATSEFELAESVTMGLPVELQNLVNNFQLLRAKPFAYGEFEFRVAGFHDGLRKLRAPRNRPPTGHTQQSTQSGPRPPTEDIVWRIRSYLDSQGHCHFCKKPCGSVPGRCPGPIDKKWQTIPDSFKTPPKPVDYKPPMPRGPSHQSAGRSTQPPAGRPAHRSASVAGILGDNIAPALDPVSVHALEAINEELRLTSDAENQLGH